MKREIDVTSRSDSRQKPLDTQTGEVREGKPLEYQQGDGRCSECLVSIIGTEDAFCIGSDRGIRSWVDGSPGDKVICRRCLTPLNVFVFQNGMIAATNARGQQVVPLMGRFTEHCGVVLHFATPETKFYGWPDIVRGGHLGEWRFP